MTTKQTIAIFGATGKVGVLLTEKILSEGYNIRALARDKNKLTLSSNRLTVIEGDILDKDVVEQTVIGANIIYVVIGTWGNKPTTVYSEGTANVIGAMKKHQIQRIICLSSAGVLGYDGGFLFGRIIAPLFLKHPFRDKRKQLDILAQSDLEWTLLRPTEIIPDRPKGEIEVTYDKPRKMKVSMKSVIDYLYMEINNTSNIHKMPIIGD
jgi:putative NADH-flavin reductase